MTKYFNGVSMLKMFLLFELKSYYSLFYLKCQARVTFFIEPLNSIKYIPCRSKFNIFLILNVLVGFKNKDVRVLIPKTESENLS